MVYMHQFNILLCFNSMRKTRLMSHKPTASPARSNHIVEDHLNRRSQFLHKYQTDIHELIDRIDTKASRTIKPNEQSFTERKSLDKSRSFSIRKETIPSDGSGVPLGNFNDYQRMALGLEYELQAERRRRQGLQTKNASLQGEISNLRNLLVGPSQQKQYEKTVLKEYQQKVVMLEGRVQDLKKNLEFLHETKAQEAAGKEAVFRLTVKKMEEGNGGNRRVLELLEKNEELQAAIARKNITIQKLLFQEGGQKEAIESEDQAQAKDLSRIKPKSEFYMLQLDICNKLILKKNMQILSLSKKVERNEQLLDVIEQYLDKKQVKNVDLTLLEHPCVAKLKNWLREKVLFQRELMGQVAAHSKIITTFEHQLLERNQLTEAKISELTNDNKKMAGTINSLQASLKVSEGSLETERRVTETLRMEIEANKKTFVEEIMKLKSQLATISNVTKNEFDRMKLQNFKLTQQNRSLLFLVGEKEKEIQKKGEAIRTFEQYKDKINNLPISAPQRRKIQSLPEDTASVTLRSIPDHGSSSASKMQMISTFSQWMMQWNKIKNWNNKKILLNVVLSPLRQMLDREQIRVDAEGSIGYLINVIHEAMLSSKNVEIQQRAIVLLSYYLKHNILKNINLFVEKIAPIVLRGFRVQIQGEDIERHRILNESALKIASVLYLSDKKWTQEMTNQMLSVNGLKYLFQTLGVGQIDELIIAAYNCLTFIARQNEMISFMNSFNVTTVVLTNLKADYPFLGSVLKLMKALLQSRDYLKTQKSLLQFRQIYPLIRVCSKPELDLILDCTLTLMQNSLFVKSSQKIEMLGMVAQALKREDGYEVLKKLGEVYAILLSELETENLGKLPAQAQRLLQIISGKRLAQGRFNRTIRILLKMAETITQSPDLDDILARGLIPLYESYGDIQGKTKVRLNQTISSIFQRNKEAINRYSNQSWIASLVQAYRQCHSNQELNFLLKVLLFQHQQKRTTEILRTGREGLIGKHINDALLPDYNVAILALKNLLSIAKEKYSQKFVNKGLFQKILRKVLNSRTEEEYLGTCISIIYFFCKNQQACLTIIDLGLVQRVFTVITERYDKESLVYKCLTLIELCHSSQYKKKILNYMISSDPSLTTLKTLNFILKRAKNKQQMGTRAVFLYDFLNSKTAYESLGMLIEQNNWMVEDLIGVRNEYIEKVNPLVYKIEMLLHSMSTVNPAVRKIYEKFKIEGEYQSEDDQE